MKLSQARGIVKHARKIGTLLKELQAAEESASYMERLLEAIDIDPPGEIRIEQRFLVGFELDSETVVTTRRLDLMKILLTELAKERRERAAEIIQEIHDMEGGE